MSWSLSAAGHCQTEQDEAKLIAELGAAFRAENAGSYSGSVSMSSQYHGSVNLLAAPVEGESQSA